MHDLSNELLALVLISGGLSNELLALDLRERGMDISSNELLALVKMQAFL
jgi:hypothetical protein